MVNTRRNKYPAEESKVPPKTSHLQGEASRSYLYNLDSPPMDSNTNEWSKAFNEYGQRPQSEASEEQERPQFDKNPIGSDSE